MILLQEKTNLKNPNLKLKNENNTYNEKINSLIVEINKLKTGNNFKLEEGFIQDYKEMYNQLLYENSNLKK